MDAADAVALGVEGWGEDGDAELAGEDGEDTAGDAALGGHADLVEPASGGVIHAAGGHDAEHAFDVFAAEGLFAGGGVDAAIGECGGHEGEVAAGDRDGALAEVGFDDRLGIGFEDVEIAEHVADGAVAVAGGAFGAVDGFVAGQFTAGVAFERLEHALVAEPG